MTSNRFSFKLVRETMRRNIWAVALSLVGFFFCLPLPAAMLIQNRIANADDPGTSRAEQLGFAANDIRMLLGADNIFAKLGICIMAVLCGVALFSYLHSRQKVDFYHSIPLKRGALFLNNYISGILMVLPALLVMYALTAVISAVMGCRRTTRIQLQAAALPRRCWRMYCFSCLFIRCRCSRPS